MTDFQTMNATHIGWVEDRNPEEVNVYKLFADAIYNFDTDELKKSIETLPINDNCINYYNYYDDDEIHSSYNVSPFLFSLYTYYNEKNDDLDTYTAIEIIKYLIEMGVNVNCTDPATGETPLMYAAKKNIGNLVVLLVENGADVNKINDKTGKTALYYCITNYLNMDKSIFRFLMNCGARINANNLCSDIVNIYIEPYAINHNVDTVSNGCIVTKISVRRTKKRKH
jgi:hypothetical protein